MGTVEAIATGTAVPSRSRDSVRRLLVAYCETRDPRARDELVAAHRGLARWAAAKFVNRGEPLDDLEQVALVGLLKAINRFDPHQGAQFSTYAVTTMLGELRRHLRDYSWRLHLPRALHDRHLAIRRTIQTLNQELGRSPTIAEIACRAGMTVELVVEAMEVGSRGRPTSLDAPSLSGEPPLVEGHAGMTRAEERADVQALLGRLSPRARRVVEMRFVQEMSQAEIATHLGVSQMQISRILSQSLARLRTWAVA